MTSTYLFDSFSLLALFQNEKGADIVDGVLQEIKQSRMAPLICAINLGEIVYITKRRFGDQAKIETLGHIYQMGFDILPATNEIVFAAAEIKAQHGISYADCFAVACAIDNAAIILTGDPEFHQVEHLVEIKWIR